MIVRIYRNIDKPLYFFGIKGPYLPYAGCATFLILIVSVVVSSMFNGIVGIMTAVVLFVLAYFALVQFQIAFGDKSLYRLRSSIGIPNFIIVRCKIWKR